MQQNQGTTSLLERAYQHAAHEINNSKNYISTNIYAEYHLEKFFESSTDSATALTEHHDPAVTTTAGPRQTRNLPPSTTPQGNIGPELMMQLIDLEQNELQQAATGNPEGLSQVM